MIWRMLSTAASPGGRSATLSVLFFHRVLPKPDVVLADEPSVARFEHMLRWIRSQFNVLPLEDAVDKLKTGTLPAAAAAISFDDGYRDNFEHAAPLLQRLSMPATFFISTDFLDGGIMWNDCVTEAVRHTARTTLALPALGIPNMALDTAAARGQVAGRILQLLKYLQPTERTAAVAQVIAACDCDTPKDLMMTTSQVVQLSKQGFGIGAHTCSHPILTHLTDAQAQAEMTGSRECLERLLGQRVRLFAYPNGRAGKDFAPKHGQIARAAGFDFAFTTEPGACNSQSDWMQLPRFTPWDRSEWRFKLRMLANQRKSRASHDGMVSAGSPH